MTYTISDYLLDRLAELTVDRIFGVPGDYTLGLLDHVVAHDRLEWVGCTNELNAGYAADGYGRMRGMAALMTTFGVGELSAINAITGSFAEHVPVVHVVGSPSSGTQAAQRIVHHSLGDGVFTHFLQMHSSITCARAALSPTNAEREIDRVLTTVRDEHLPGYLLLPADVGEVSTDPPAEPLPPPTDPTDPEALEAFGRAATQLLAELTNVAQVSVLGGLLVHRTRATAQLTRLLTAGPLTHATSLWGKSLVDESNPYYAGIYAGAASEPAVRAAVEDAFVLVIAGVQFTDLNSGFFSQQIDRRRTIELGATVASVGAATFAPVTMAAALDTLAQIVEQSPLARPRAPVRSAKRSLPEPDAGDGSPLSQAQLWGSVAAFLRPGDVVLADQGTSFYGMGSHRLPERVMFLGQPLWASIGYTLPALVGACLAAPGRRGVLLVGDGAAQMTVQELSTLIRERIPAVVIIVDNDGYTVERAIHGAEQPYNDIARWDWRALVASFSPDDAFVSSHQATTATALNVALEQARACEGVSLIQAIVPRMDVPNLLSLIAREASRANQRSD
jgi:TPP-dependent 2-oxoacid decarboxylase